MKRAQKKQKTLVILGPTAVGKSALATALARKFNGEVISADSRQVYRGLNIGTGKITKREMRGVRHHLLDVADPRQQFTVVQYQKRAREKIAAIFSRGRLPIVCGGTGWYIDTLLNNTALPEVPPNPKLRKGLEKKSTTELFALLKRLDPRRASTIDRSNPRRLIRAIEIATDADRTQTKRGQDAEKESEPKVQPYDALWIGLAVPTEELKKRIATRLSARIKGGMVAEVKKLRQQGLTWKRLDNFGLEYRYLSKYLQGKISREERVRKLKTEIWRYAKRQMTWFKRKKEIKWFNPTEKQEIEKEVRRFLRN